MPIMHCLEMYRRNVLHTKRIQRQGRPFRCVTNPPLATLPTSNLRSGRLNVEPNPGLSGGGGSALFIVIPNATRTD